MRVVSLFRLEALNISTKYAIVNSLHQVTRLVEASDYLGPFVTASVAGATTEEAKSVADNLASHYELGTTLLGHRTIREPSARLDRLDWQIMKELRYDARSGEKDLAETLSVTQRMIGYRVSRLLGTGAVHVKAVINPRKQAGLVFYELELLVDLSEQVAVSKWLKEKHGEQLWNLSTTMPGVILASLFSFTLAEPEESIMEALKREGVRRCFLFILKEVLEPMRPNWIDSLIELRIASHDDEAQSGLRDKAAR
jgi:DNA-binding Lrp family transcriptional regulator